MLPPSCNLPLELTRMGTSPTTKGIYLLQVVCYLCPHERDQSGGWVLKFAPDPSWVSIWVSKLIITDIKKIKYVILIYNRSLSKNKIFDYYVILV